MAMLDYSDHQGQCLQKAKAELEKSDFPELRTVGSDTLMCAVARWGWEWMGFLWFLWFKVTQIALRTLKHLWRFPKSWGYP
jgi:hypothetical protein